MNDWMVYALSWSATYTSAWPSDLPRHRWNRRQSQLHNGFVGPLSGSVCRRHPRRTFQQPNPPPAGRDVRDEWIQATGSGSMPSAGLVRSDKRRRM